MTQQDPYLAALDLVRQHSGSSGQIALAKCILSLYNRNHSFSIGDILIPLDRHYSKIVFDMIAEFSRHGETEELRTAGRYTYDNFPHLIELSEAMSHARGQVQKKWDDEYKKEMKRLYPED